MAASTRALNLSSDGKIDGRARTQTNRQGVVRAVLYARYSTEKQSESSIDDQFRVCERLAERHSFTVVGRFQDAALSGGTTRREGYQRLLEAARRGEFDVIVAEDVSRLWRAMAEQAPRLAELRDLDVNVVTQDLDTRQESSEILGAVNGAMSEHYRKEIGRRTRRGLEGRARAGKPTGGLAYGYVPARDSPTGKMEIQPEQAKVVRRIFGDYARGLSPRAIAAALNCEGVPSPGSMRKRAEVRPRPWMASAIAGDAKRGCGILNNEIYIGRVIYGRFRWLRSALDSSRRRCVENPRQEWIVRADESLRVVPQKLWGRVKQRQKARSETIGGSVRKGLQAAQRCRPGRKPKYLFSGLLRCGSCGARFVIADRTHYACSSRLNAGTSACPSEVRIKRTVVESGLREGIKSDLLSSAILADIAQQTRSALKEQRRARAPSAQRLAVAEEEIRNLVAAIGNGKLRGSQALAERLAMAEEELATLKRVPGTVRAADLQRLVGLVIERYRAMVASLERSLPLSDVEEARAHLRGIFGSIKVVSDEREIRFLADLRDTHLGLLKGVGATANNVVAGARSAHTLTAESATASSSCQAAPAGAWNAGRGVTTSDPKEVTHGYRERYTDPHRGRAAALHPHPAQRAVEVAAARRGCCADDPCGGAPDRPPAPAEILAALPRAASPELGVEIAARNLIAAIDACLA